MLLTLGLLAALLIPSAAWAAPKENDRRGDRLRDWHMLNVDVGVGVPYKIMFRRLSRLQRLLGGSNISSIPSLVFGVSYGYIPPGHGRILPNGARILFAPEIGTRFHFSKNFGFHGRVFREVSMQIPLIANLQVNPPTTSFVVRVHLGIGYELDIALSSSLISSGGSGQNRINKQRGLSRFSGSIFFVERATFRKGIFIKFKVKIPLRIFSMRSDVRTILDRTEEDGLDENCIKILRTFGTSLYEFSLGLDIMELF